MSLRARQQEEKQERRDSILDAAEQVFFERGYERATMDHIARQAGLSRGLLYVYFRDKQGILASIMLRAAEGLRQRFRDMDRAELCGAERIEAMGRNYLAFSIEQPNYFDVLTRAASDWPQADTQTDLGPMQVCTGEIMEIMSRAIADGISDQSIDPARVRDPLQTALYLRGALHGVIMMTRNSGKGPAAPELTEPAQLVEYTIRTLASSIRLR